MMGTVLVSSRPSILRVVWLGREPGSGFLTKLTTCTGMDLSPPVVLRGRSLTVVLTLGLVRPTAWATLVPARWALKPTSRPLRMVFTALASLTLRKAMAAAVAGLVLRLP